MKLKSMALWLGASIALVGSFVQPARADEWNKKTEFTFNVAVQIPGKILPAGKYVFQLAPSESDRNIIQVFAEDSRGRLSLIATLFAVPEYEYKTPDKPGVRLAERAAGMPEAIHSWYYPGDDTGWEFIYSKSEKETLSASAPKRLVRGEKTTVDLPAAPVVNSQAALASEATASEAKVEPVVERAEEAPAPPAAAVAPAPAPAPAPADPVLPETAGDSGMLLIGALGMTVAGFASLAVSRRG